MAVGQVAAAVLAGIIVLSLAGIVMVFLAGLVVSVRTVASARRRSHELSHRVSALARSCAVSELAEIDETLDRIWAENRGAAAGQHLH